MIESAGLDGLEAGRCYPRNVLEFDDNELPPEPASTSDAPTDAPADAETDEHAQQQPESEFAEWSAADIRAHLEFTLSRRVRSTIYRGAMDARRRDERYAVAHLFYALLADRDGDQALTLLGADPAHMRRWMDEHRAVGYPGPWADDEFTEQLHNVLFDFYQNALYAQCHHVDAAHLLVSLFQCADRDNPAVALLREGGVTVLKLREYAAHGARRRSRLARLWNRIFGARLPALVGVERGLDSALAPLGARMELRPIPDAEVHVVIHNDPYTTKVFVFDMLQNQFSMDPRQAEAITARTHQAGWAYLGQLSRDVATMRIRDVHDLARAQGFPLRLSMHRKRPRS